MNQYALLLDAIQWLLTGKEKKKKNVAPLSSSLPLAVPTQEATAECSMLTQQRKGKVSHKLFTKILPLHLAVKLSQSSDL